MFERFTDKGRKIIILAREEAERHQNDYLGTEHLVLAILRETDGIALMILKKMGLSTEQIRLEIERNLPGGGTTMTFGEIPFSPRVKKVIEYGVEEARLLGHNHIGSEHLLLGLLREEEGIGGKILRSLGANLLTARQLTVTFLRKSAPRERDRKSNVLQILSRRSKTIPYSSVNRGWGKQPSSRDSPSVSSRRKSRTICCPVASSRSTWAHWWPARNTAASLKSASRS